MNGKSFFGGVWTTAVVLLFIEAAVDGQLIPILVFSFLLLITAVVIVTEIVIEDNV